MHKRYLTFFLVWTLLIPAGVFGAVRHSCLMPDVGKICSHLEKSDHSAHGGAVEAGADNCEFRAAPKSPSAVGSTAYAARLDAPQPAEAPPLYSNAIYFSAPSGKTLPAGVCLYLPGGQPPLFIRHCSFLS